MNSLLMGIPGVGEVYPGSHICALFAGPVERDRLLVQFLQEGLRRGDQCVCFIDELEPASTRQRAYGGVGLEDHPRSGRLDFHAAPDAYLHSGAVSPRQRISGLVSAPESSADRRLPLLRAAGQMPNDSSGATSARDFLAYESAVILILAELPTLFLCLYDMRHFGMGTLAGVLKVHSRVLLDGIVLYNPTASPRAGTRHPRPAAPRMMAWSVGWTNGIHGDRSRAPRYGSPGSWVPE